MATTITAAKDSCSNCLTELNGNKNHPACFKLIDIVGTGGDTKPVTIISALCYLFRIQRKSLELETCTDWNLCYSCGSILQKLVDLLRQFNNICKLLSPIDELKKHRRYEEDTFTSTDTQTPYEDLESIQDSLENNEICTPPAIPAHADQLLDTRKLRMRLRRMKTSDSSKELKWWKTLNLPVNPEIEQEDEDSEPPLVKCRTARSKRTRKSTTRRKSVTSPDLRIKGNHHLMNVTVELRRLSISEPVKQSTQCERNSEDRNATLGELSESSTTKFLDEQDLSDVKEQSRLPAMRTCKLKNFKSYSSLEKKRAKRKRTATRTSKLYSDYIRNLLNKGVKNYPCSHCDYVAKSAWIIHVHIRRVHEKMKDFICSHCGKTFVCRQGLNGHIRVTHGDTPKRYECQEPGCGKSFAYDAGLRVHRYAHNRLLQKVQCEICDRLCRSKHDLMRHMFSHSEERSVMCDLCGGCFKTMPTLLKHRKYRHSDVFGRDAESKSTCLICKKVFKTPGNMRQHVRAIHEQLRPYGCGICGKEFSATNNLRVHLQGFHKLNDEDVKVLRQSAVDAKVISSN